MGCQGLKLLMGCLSYLKVYLRVAKNGVICNWPYNWFCNSLQLIIFLHLHDCYQTSCMICNECYSPYVKPYTYTIHAIHAIQLQLCKNNYYAILMQLV